MQMCLIAELFEIDLVTIYEFSFIMRVLNFCLISLVSGNIGSTCGFVTGFSFVSVLEFLYFYTVRLMRDYLNRRRRERRIASCTSTPAHFGHDSRYRPIYWNEIAGPNVLKVGNKFH